MRRIRLEGTIAASGFASGDRIVVGLWQRGPLGEMVDVMWARPDGARILLAPNAGVGEFVGGIYDFDRVEVVDIDARLNGDRLVLSAGALRFEATAGRWLPLFSLRPRVLRRSPAWVRLEDFLFRRVVGRFLLGGAPGVRTYGTTRSGVREWYSIDWYRPLIAAHASVDGAELGAMAPLLPPSRFGISEFPARPAMVGASPLLEGDFAASVPEKPVSTPEE